MSEPVTKAQEFRTRAEAEHAAGAAASLEQVRLKHERAAQVWTDMATAEEARVAEKAARDAAQQAAQAAEPA